MSFYYESREEYLKYHLGNRIYDIKTGTLQRNREIRSWFKRRLPTMGVAGYHGRYIIKGVGSMIDLRIYQKYDVKVEFHRNGFDELEKEMKASFNYTVTVVTDK
jgi:hypothetical protein